VAGLPLVAGLSRKETHAPSFGIIARWRRLHYPPEGVPISSG